MFRYLDTWQWSDGTIAYYLKIAGFSDPPYCAAFHKDAENATLTVINCDDSKNAPSFVCEMKTEVDQIQGSESSAGARTRNSPQANASGIFLQTLSASQSPRGLTLCPAQHRTHLFLACDSGSACWVDGYGASASCAAPMTPLPPSFTCRNRIESVPYTLVCDHRSDCSDGSDEDFCQYPSCNPLTQFSCGGKQVGI
ncbi:hypothetical protein BaRGS_00021571 [Batillaria attramentaria]|uniref:Low-density lipoprotein receptor domain class A n=1 Tax=Batillaria attramentaria TaxID=370345 RepID=A0ABD0KJ43_9CAEN